MESAKIKALLYADLFDYPLTHTELEKWKINDHLSSNIYYLSSIENADGYYYLKGRKKIVVLRKKRERISQKKLIKAQKAVNLLKKIPTIKMIALTGGLAMQNSKEVDDIDFLIVAQKGTLWLTRLLATLLLDLKGWRRQPIDKNFANKICLNMFLEDGFLTLPVNEQDLYGAHEVYQIKPLYERDDNYSRFLTANSWTKKYLPQAIDIKILGYEDTKQKKRKSPNILISQSLNILNLLAKLLQLWYMKRHRTTEVITDHMLRFHPKDYRQQVLEKYQKRLKIYEQKI